MNTKWNDGKKAHQVMAPVSLLISAFANVKNISKSLTPYFDKSKTHAIFYLDLADGCKRLGASSIAQVYQQLGKNVPDLNDVDIIKSFWQFMQSSVSAELISAYHDISDGGLFVTILEICLASQCGLIVDLDYSDQPALNILFSEELGVVLAVEKQKESQFMELVDSCGLKNHIYVLGETDAKLQSLEFKHKQISIYKNDLNKLHEKWAKTSHLMASLRDNPKTCDQEYSLISTDDKGITPKVNFQFDQSVIAPYLNLHKPKIAILREQGVNGQKEMAMAFHKSGFESHDVHMQDLLEGKVDLMNYQGLAACGGFSYGDVLGAGKGWANSILFHENIKKQFSNFFNNNNKFALGVCNGCQMLSSLKDIIPGAEHWPEFLKNESEQFEARYSSLQIENSNSIFFKDMQGAHIPVAIAHGEGRAVFGSNKANIAASYIDNNGLKTQKYPFNPNGSQQAAAAVTNNDGNVMIMMPHPERVFRAVQMSWSPKTWENNSPWMRMFYNARMFVN
jgi:phosphoribosylformylglycinamidine synthase